MDSQIKLAVSFFKENKKYHRILVQMAKNYRSRGVVGGSIFLENLTFDERMVICKIDSKFIDAKDARFSVKKLIKTFDNTPIAGVDFYEVLQGYFGGELLTHKSVKEEKEKIREQYFTKILSAYEGTPGAKWISSIFEGKAYGYSLVIREYNTNPKELAEILDNVLRGINRVAVSKPDYVRLAIFSSMVTKDPHYFDGRNIGGRLLINALAFLEDITPPESSEEQSELLYRFGIIKDEISNYTTCANIAGIDANGEHLGIKGFVQRGEPIQLNLFTLAGIIEFHCTNKQLYVFENPTVFSEVFHSTLDFKPSLLCTSGQLKLASRVFLDKLVDKVDRIYYSGDFDPEGLNIASGLKQRYGDKLVLWKYDVKTYKAILSQVEINDKRLRKLESIKNTDISELVEEMKKKRKCAYQELLVDEYIKDIRNGVRL